MKITACLLISMMWLAQENDSNKIIKVEFTSLTRGYQENIVLTPDSIRGSRPERDDRTKVNTFSKTITTQEWKHLTSTVNAVPRAQFEGLPSPTNKRAFDGAKHSSIIITLANRETYQHTFDDENPNEKLVPLMKCISNLRAQAMGRK